MKNTHSILPVDKIAVQLYTIRDHLALNPINALEKLAELGITQVELAFWPANFPAEKAAPVLRSLGLQVCAAHIQIPLEESHIQQVKASFGCNRFIWHGWPEDPAYSSLSETRRLIRQYNEYARLARETGTQFGLHNHWWEFRNKLDGKYVFEWLLEETDPDIFFELDVYWIQFAGLNPAEIIPLFGKRACLLHLKDGPAQFRESISLDNMDDMTPLGQGTLPIAQIMECAQPNAPLYVLEMDQTAGDVFEALKTSLHFLRNSGNTPLLHE